MYQTISINKRTGETKTIRVMDDLNKAWKLAERCTFCESNRNVIYMAINN